MADRTHESGAQADRRRPNFLVIVADDLGFSDLGCYGGEISTPNLDRLALGPSGLRMTSFHTASACSPTRSMLLSGTDNHLAGLGQMAETIARNPFLQGRPGYEGVLNDRVAAVSEIVSEAGYATWLSGKWHLGLTAESSPHARGFEQSWTLLPGAGNHYAYDARPEGSEGTLKFMPPLYMANGEFVSPADLPKPFYSTDVFTDKWLAFHASIKERDPKQPWLSFLTYTAPHWPLQAPQEVINKYKGRYARGPAHLRQERLEKLLERGLIPESSRTNAAQPATMFADQEVPDVEHWETMDESSRLRSQRCMEVYAAMVEKMDEAIGKVIARLEESGEMDNTLIIFQSDNGAEGALLEAVPLAGIHFERHLSKHFDNSLDNIGRESSFVWYGPAWAQAATAPSRRYKAWITEGGIRCPAIVHFPPSLGGSAGAAIFQKHISNAFTTVMDICPTILELADLQHPAPRWRGREILPVRGTSWVQHLRNESESVHDSLEMTGWELFGQQAVRQGDWKALFLPKPNGPEKWQLFRLTTDPGETLDLAVEEPEQLAKMVDWWTTYIAETGTIVDMDNPLAPGYGAH